MNATAASSSMVSRPGSIAMRCASRCGIPRNRAEGHAQVVEHCVDSCQIDLRGKLWSNRGGNRCRDRTRRRRTGAHLDSPARRWLLSVAPHQNGRPGSPRARAGRTERSGLRPSRSGDGRVGSRDGPGGGMNRPSGASSDRAGPASPSRASEPEPGRRVVQGAPTKTAPKGAKRGRRSWRWKTSGARL